MKQLFFLCLSFPLHAMEPLVGDPYQLTLSNNRIDIVNEAAQLSYDECDSKIANTISELSIKYNLSAEWVDQAFGENFVKKSRDDGISYDWIIHELEALAYALNDDQGQKKPAPIAAKPASTSDTDDVSSMDSD